jgi:hypothetical protein
MKILYNLVYPERRSVTEDTVRMRYADAVANGEVDYPDLTAIDDIIAELESAGEVTFSSPTYIY